MLNANTVQACEYLAYKPVIFFAICKWPRFAETFLDELHSEEEDRSITIGLSSKQDTLSIVHREFDNRIRLIGARRANAMEIKAYEELKARS